MTEQTKKGWINNGVFIPFDQMNDDQLQHFYLDAERKQLRFFNKLQSTSALVDDFNEEASKRGIVLKDRENEFFDNTRKLKSTITQS